MKRLLHTLLITIFVYGSSLISMEHTIPTQANPLCLKEIIIIIAGFCWPKEKNILIKVCKDFSTYVKDRTLILQANPYTVSVTDKKEAIFTYTSSNNIEMMNFLLQHRISANGTNIFGITLFHIASDNNSIQAMELLMSYGAHINVLEPKIQPLHEAAYKGNEEAVKTLLKLKVDPNLALANGNTALYLACYKGHTTIVESLLYAGALVNLPNKDGSTPLHSASDRGHTNTVKLLLAAEAHVNHKNNNGWIPLCFASEKGYTNITQLLLTARANVNHTNKDDTTPLHFASQKGHFKVVQLLINKKAQVNRPGYNGTTPLMLASRYGHIEIVRLLLDNGADMHPTLYTDSTVDPMIKKGDTALQLAQKKGHTHIVELLQEYLKKKNESCTIQ